MIGTCYKPSPIYIFIVIDTNINQDIFWLWLVTNLHQYIFLLSFILTLIKIYFWLSSYWHYPKSVIDVHEGMFWLYWAADIFPLHQCYGNHQCQWPRPWLLQDHCFWCTGPVIKNNVMVTNKSEKHCTLEACCVHAMCMCIYYASVD